MAKSIHQQGEEGIIVREAAAADLHAIEEIEQESFSSPWGFERWGEEHYGMELFQHMSKFLVAESGDEVIGYTCGRTVADEGHILKLAVRLDWRRHGIGSMLMATIMKQLYEGGSRIFWLEVRQSNHAAQHFYRELDFGLYGVRKGYYSDTREDALVLAKRMEEWAPKR